jgi:hypothetical protein
MIDPFTMKLLPHQWNSNQESWTFGFEIINCSQDHDKIIKWWNDEKSNKTV